MCKFHVKSLLRLKFTRKDCILILFSPVDPIANITRHLVQQLGVVGQNSLGGMKNNAKKYDRMMFNMLLRGWWEHKSN